MIPLSVDYISCGLRFICSNPCLYVDYHLNAAQFYLWVIVSYH